MKIKINQQAICVPLTEKEMRRFCSDFGVYSKGNKITIRECGRCLYKEMELSKCLKYFNNNKRVRKNIIYYILKHNMSKNK